MTASTSSSVTAPIVAQLDHDAIAALTLRVRDLDRAASFLRARQLLGDCSASRVTIAPHALGCLVLHLVAEVPEPLCDPHDSVTQNFRGQRLVDLVLWW